MSEKHEYLKRDVSPMLSRGSKPDPKIASHQLRISDLLGIPVWIVEPWGMCKCHYQTEWMNPDRHEEEKGILVTWGYRACDPTSKTNVLNRGLAAC